MCAANGAINIDPALILYILYFQLIKAPFGGFCTNNEWVTKVMGWVMITVFWFYIFRCPGNSHSHMGLVDPSFSQHSECPSLH
uniref:Uncharacterized protein n=1 Tax=Anguilla anguilla TaxID=7936 RepID=A0A0E9X7H3_ANGAN